MGGQRAWQRDGKLLRCRWWIKSVFRGFASANGFPCLKSQTKTLHSAINANELVFKFRLASDSSHCGKRWVCKLWLPNKGEADGAFCYEEAALFDSSKAILRPVIRISQETSDHISVLPAGQKNTSSTIWTDQRKLGTNWLTKMTMLWKGQQPLTATVSNLLFSPCDSIWKLHYAHILLQAIDGQQLLEPIFKRFLFSKCILLLI